MPPRFLRPLTPFVVACGVFAAAPALADSDVISTSFTVAHINDVYQIGAAGDSGGLPAVMTILNQAEAAAGGNVLFTHGGDMISPSLMSTVDNGAHMIDMLNQMGLDFAVLGNHEFDFGPDVAAERIAEAQFTWLGANVMRGGAVMDGLAATAMVDFDGVKIGLFGLTLEETDVLSSPGDVSFSDVTAAAEASVAALRGAGAHMVLGIAHIGGDEAEALLEAVDGLDFLFTGHDHAARIVYDGGAGQMEAAADAAFVAVATFDVTVKTRDDGGVDVDWRPSFALPSTRGVEPDAAIAAAAQSYADLLDEEMNIAIATTAVTLDTRRATVRSRESNFGDLVADAMRLATGADIGFANGGGIRGDRVYEPGTTLTRRDVLTELPFGNVTVLLEVSGATVRAALENGVSRIEDGAGRFPQVSGLSFALDAAAPAGSRVGEVSVGGAALDDAATYALATNDYMARGGDGYSMFADAKVLIDASGATLMASQVMDHISAMGEVTQQAEGRIRRLE